MHFWIREIAGWLLVGLGLYIFYQVVQLLLRENPGLLQAGPLTVVGFVVFRGGIHLLKVAVAARICLHADRALKSNPAPRIMGKGTSISPHTLDW